MNNQNKIFTSTPLRSGNNYKLVLIAEQNPQILNNMKKVFICFMTTILMVTFCLPVVAHNNDNSSKSASEVKLTGVEKREAKRNAREDKHKGFYRVGINSLETQYVEAKRMAKSNSNLVLFFRDASAPTYNLAATKAELNLVTSVATSINSRIEGVIRAAANYNELQPGDRDAFDMMVSAARAKFSLSIGDALTTVITERLDANGQITIRQGAFVDKKLLKEVLKDSYSALNSALKKARVIDELIDKPNSDIDKAIDSLQ